MTKREENILRANILGGMNEYVLNVIGDDDITDYWLTYGVPDECDEDMLMEFASDKETFRDMVMTFKHCVFADDEDE